VTEIVDPKQAEEEYRKWRRENPEEALAHDKEFEEWKQDPVKFKKFMENKGFHFSMSNDEFLKQVKKLNLTSWQKFLKWLNKKPSAEKKIKNFRWIAALYVALGIFCIVMAGVSTFQASNSYLHGGFDSPLNQEQIRALWYLITLTVIDGLAAALGGLMFIVALYAYSQSLELRVKELEKFRQHEESLRETVILLLEKHRKELEELHKGATEKDDRQEET
jgi:hypothetical protein